MEEYRQDASEREQRSDAASIVEAHDVTWI